MTDNAPADLSDIPFDDAPVAPSPPAPRADLIAVEICLDAVLPDGLIDALARRKPVAVAIVVPSEAWCDPVQDRVTALVSAARFDIAGSSVRPRDLDPAFIVRRGPPTHKQRREDQSRAAAALTTGHGLVGISVGSGTALPEVLAHVPDYHVAIGRPTGDQLQQVIGRVTGEQPDPVTTDGLGGFDLNDLATCVRRGSSAAECIVRLGEIRRARSSAPDDDVPPLDHMHGYGAAQDWGLALARDIDRLRSGDPGITLASLPRGILLSGPPGVGKSIYCRSLAKTAGVPLVITSVGEWLSSGDGHLDDVLNAARASAASLKERPGILMWDEVDSIVDRRIGERASKAWWTSFVNGILTLVDSLPAGTILIGACNHPDIVDPALKRSGRLDVAVAIPLPDMASREGIFRVHLRSDLADADLARIVHATHGRSGADIARYVREARQRARDNGAPLTLADLESVILPPEPRSPDVLARCAVHEAAHAVVATALGLEVEAVTLQQTDTTGGLTSVVAGRDPVPTRAALELEVIGALAGRAADLAGSGANAGAGGSWSSDLGFATRTLAMIHGSLGLGSSLVFRGAPDEIVQALAHDPDLRDVVEADLVRLLNRAMALVEHHAAAIGAVADALIRERVLTGDDVLAIMAMNPPWKRSRRRRGLSTGSYQRVKNRPSEGPEF